MGGVSAGLCRPGWPRRFPKTAAVFFLFFFFFAGRTRYLYENHETTSLSIGTRRHKPRRSSQKPRTRTHAQKENAAQNARPPRRPSSGGRCRSCCSPRAACGFSRCRSRGIRCRVKRRSTSQGCSCFDTADFSNDLVRDSPCAAGCGRTWNGRRTFASSLAHAFQHARSAAAFSA